MNNLHPRFKWLLRFKAYVLLLFICLFISSWVLPFIAVVGAATGSSIVSAFFLLPLLYLIVIVGIGEAYARMSYSRWLYEFTADGLKLEHGIIWKKYSTVPFERVQNVDIKRGIVARMCGFSTVMLQTAGYSGGPQAEGNIPAVSIQEAEGGFHREGLFPVLKLVPGLKNITLLSTFIFWRAENTAGPAHQLNRRARR